MLTPRRERESQRVYNPEQSNRRKPNQREGNYDLGIPTTLHPETQQFGIISSPDITQLRIQLASYQPNNAEQPQQFDPYSLPNREQQLSGIQKIILAPLHLKRRWFLFRQARHVKQVLEQEMGGQDESKISILDVGSGRGMFADILHETMPKAKVVCTDIEDRHKGEAPFVLASGDKLPFPDNSFDAATILYVLHHVPDPKAVLKEMKRVSKGKVIVHEDTYTNPIEELAYRIHVHSYRFGLPSSSISPVRTDAQWQQIFRDSGFDVSERHRVHNFSFYPVKRYAYVLSPQDRDNTPITI